MKASLPVVLTPTRVELGQRCYRRHAIQDVLERDKNKNTAAAFGNVIHAGDGAWWDALEFGGKDARAAIELSNAALEAEWKKQGLEGKDERYTIDKGFVMLNAYRSQAARVGPYTGMTDWGILTVEDRVKLPIRNEAEEIVFYLSFQIDRAYKSGLNKIVVLDIKTVTRPDARWKATWYNSVQMKLYSYAARIVYGVDDIEFVIEGLDKNAKPKLHIVMLPQWNTAVLEEAYREFSRIALQDEAMIRQALDADGNLDIEKLEEFALVQTGFNRQDCYAYNMPCAFLPLCDAEPEYRRGILHAEYKELEADY